MAPADTLVAFLLATAAFAFLPGPGVLYSVAQTVAHGRRGGLHAAIGLHMGGLFHVIAAAAGLSVLFTLVPTLYAILKITGALYLIWLGIGIIRRGILRPTGLTGRQNPRRPATFAQSVTVEVLNPKTAMFFVAFLPQFADASASLPVWTQMLILGLIVNVMFTVSDLVAIFFTDRVISALKGSSRVQKLANWLGGSILIGLGVHLAASRA